MSSSQPTDFLIDKSEEEIVIEERLDELIDNITFQNIVINQEETIWEYIINDGLFFSDFEELNVLGISLCDLREKYYANLSSPLYTLITFEEEQKLYQIIDDYYGTSMLPETNLTLAQIDRSTLPLEERMNTPISDCKAETYIRASKCQASSHPSRAMLYQTGRAADDVVKILAANNCSLEEMLFFSYIAVSFYLLSLQHEDSENLEDMEVSNEYIQYQLAKIYLHLYTYSGYAHTDAYSEHFLLSAEAHMQISDDLWKANSAAKGGDRFDTMPEYAYDFACILDSFYSVYSCNNPTTKADCVKYAKEHNVYYGEGNKYYVSCKQFINKYGEETDTSTKE